LGGYYDLYTKQPSIDTNLFFAPGEGDVLPEQPATAQREPSSDNPGDTSFSSAIRLIRSQDRQVLILRQKGRQARTLEPYPNSFAEGGTNDGRRLGEPLLLF